MFLLAKYKKKTKTLAINLNVAMKAERERGFTDRQCVDGGLQIRDVNLGGSSQAGQEAFTDLGHGQQSLIKLLQM